MENQKSDRQKKVEKGTFISIETRTNGKTTSKSILDLSEEKKKWIHMNFEAKQFGKSK